MSILHSATPLPLPVYFSPSWGKRAAHNRAQIVYYIAENLELRHDEVAARISAMTGREMADCKREVDLAIQRLFYWGAYADKYGGTVQVWHGVPF